MEHPISIGDQTEWQAKGLERLRYEYDLKPYDVVLDIGAFNGVFARGIAERQSKCNILAYEPTDACYKIGELWLDDLVSNGLLDNIIIGRKFALWTFTGKIVLGGENFWTSIVEKYNLKEYICKDIYIECNGLSEMALVKINIEGGEYTLLPYMISKGMLPKIKHLQVQFHHIKDHDSEAEYEAIAAELRKTHKLSWRYPFVWESWERIK